MAELLQCLMDFVTFVVKDGVLFDQLDNCYLLKKDTEL
jgi:hypothetical protein